MNVDSSRNLNGEIDFLFTKANKTLRITEAKIGLIDKGIPQATAQIMLCVFLMKKKEDFSKQ